MSALTGHSQLYVGPMTEYSHEVAVGLRALMPHLDPDFSGELTAEREQILRTIVQNPDFFGQIVAVRTEGDSLDNNRVSVLGGISLSAVLGAGFGKRVQMEDVVVHPDARGQGIGPKMLEAAENWCAERGYGFILFETEDIEGRQAALGMYAGWRAERITDGENNKHGIVYRKDISREGAPSDGTG